MRVYIILLYLVKFSFAFNQDSEQLTIHYFQEKNVKTLCILSCFNNTEDFNFIKVANKHSFTVQRFIVSNSINISELRACLQQTYTFTGVIFNTGCVFFEDIMIHVSENNFFDSNHIWLIVDDVPYQMDNNSIGKVNDNLEDERDNFAKLNLSVNADLTIARRKASGYELREVFNFGRLQGGSCEIKIIGYWSIETGLSLKNRFKYLRRFDFQGLVLRLMIVYQGKPEEFRPEILLERDVASGISIVTQTSAMILHEVANIHNINFNYSLCDRWVGDYKRESRNAVTNALYFRDIDITPTLRFLPSHIDYYDVIHQYVTYAEGKYFYRIPTTGLGKFENQFLTPFTSGVWLSVVVVISLCGVGLLLAAALEERPQSAHYAFFSVVALACQQFFEDVNDNIVKRNSTARKLTVLVTGISCVLVFNYYTSSVVSWLLNGPPPSINSLWELMDSPLEPIFEDVGYTWSWLQLPDYYYNKKNAEAEDVLKKRIKKKGKLILTTPAEGVEMIRTGAYAFHCDSNSANKYIAKTFTSKELCDLDSLPSFEKALLYTSVQKNSPYREFFVWSYARITEQGIMNLIHTRTYTLVMKCEGSTPRALAMGGAAPAFLVLAFGFTMGTLIMFIERLLKARKDKKSVKNKYLK